MLRYRGAASAPISLLLLWGCGHVSAETIANLATGLDARDTLLTVGGSTDAHWTVDATGGGTQPAQFVASSNQDFFPDWQPNGPNSDWIARSAFTSDNGPAPYSFYRTFDLTGFDLSTVTVAGAWELDDEGTLSLNGHQLGPYHVHDEWFNGLESFTAGASLLNPGVNTLTITIAANDRFYEGVRLEGQVTGSVPEPTCVSLPSLAALSTVPRRRRGW